MASEVAAIFEMPCPDCGVLPGQPCVALRQTRYRRRGEIINDFHALRVLEAFPPASTRADDA